MAGDQELAHEVLRAIRRIVRRIAEHSHVMAGEIGLTVPQLMCLKAVGELDGEPTVAMVAERVQLSSATVSRIVERLVRAGLVLRERGLVDRRRVRLSLSDAGAKQFETLPTPLQEEFVERLAQLPEDERRVLLGSLHRIAELMQAEDLDASPILTVEQDVRAGSGE